MTPDLARVLAANLRRGAYVDDNNDEVADALDRLADEVESWQQAAATYQASRDASDQRAEEHRLRANEAARLSAEANDRADAAERRWVEHQEVCVMASLDRETLETERDEARAQVAAVEALCDASEWLNAEAGYWFSEWAAGNYAPTLSQGSHLPPSAVGLVRAALGGA